MRRIVRIATIGALTLGLLVPATGAFAKGSDAQIKTGSCTAASDWKLKAKADDGRIEVEFEVDTNRNGRAFGVRLRRDGNLVWSGTRITEAPSGSFSVERRISNSAGDDVIVGRAVRGSNVCRGQVTFAR